MERDPFWDNEARTEKAKRPTNKWDAAQSLVFWGAIVVIVWLLCGAPGLK